MTATTTEKPNDLALLRRLADPRARLKKAAEIITKAEQDAAEHSLRRNAAAALLYRRAEEAGKPVAPVAMWRDTIRVSRSLWHKIMDEANPARLTELRAELDQVEAELRDLADEDIAEQPRLANEQAKLARRVARHVKQLAAIDQLQAELAANPELSLRAIAQGEAAIVRAAEMLAVEVMPIRDELAVELMNGTHGKPVPNADIARMTGLSTARVAQLRNTR